MELQHLIIPKENRVIVYSVLNDLIINSKQLLNYPTQFQVDALALAKIRTDCLDATSETENVYSFIYIYSCGKIDTEINVKWTKYDLHPAYND